jgi:hypothetical protein
MSVSGTRRTRRWLAASIAVGSTSLLIAAGCTQPGTGTPRPTTPTWAPPTTSPTTPTTDGHGHTDDDHANMTTTTMGGGHDDGGDHGHGGGHDADPTPAQIARAEKLVADTKAAVQRQGLNSVAGLRRAGFFSIGDEMTGTTHYVHNQRHYDGRELDPEAIEAFAVRRVNGVETVIAAMYILENGKTMADVPDIAGNWTVWHDHNLPFQSNNPREDAYYKLGGRYMRQTAPMLHVWLVDNPCGPFAGTDTRNMTGSCSHGH